jgi:CopG family transcriptional regulator / antitoxin EndoAI
MDIGMRTTKIISVSLPPGLLKEARRIAKEEGRTNSELIREALRRYIIEQEYRGLQRFGIRRAKRLGIKERDVERLIQEYRSGKRR